MGADQSADAVFGLLADETRVDILRAVAIAQSERESANPGLTELTFSEIYDRVDVDNTSKLSYHLGELAGTFLRKSDDGYSFTHAGERIVRFILSGNYETPTDFGPKGVSGTCLFCGETSLEARVHHQYFRVECRNCERTTAAFPVTPAETRSGDHDLIRHVKRKQAADFGRIRRGTCPRCSGRLSTEVTALSEGPLPDTVRYLTIDRCEDCLRRYNAPLAYGVVYHPASVAFHWNRGIDVTSRGLWEFHEHLYEGRWTSERVSTEPDEYEVVLGRGDDALRVRLDSSATVTRTERVRRRSVGDRE